MKSHKHDRTACLPFPPPAEDLQHLSGGSRPRCVRGPISRQGGPGESPAALASAALASAELRTATPPLALHRFELQDLRGQAAPAHQANRSTPGYQASGHQASGHQASGHQGPRLPVFPSEARRGARRAPSSPRPAPRTDRGPSLTVATPSARAVRQSEACAFYLDLVGAVTAMTLVVLAAILV